MTAEIRSQRTTDPDGAAVDIFPLTTDEANLEQLLRDCSRTTGRQLPSGR
jgi:hypothetical protein